VADQKLAADQSHEAGVDYVDTSAYEQYEKQEGDFVEGTEAFTEAAAAEATVPPKPPCRPKREKVKSRAWFFNFSGPALCAPFTPGHFSKTRPEIFAQTERKG